MSDFIPGDVVRLKSGGSKMTVKFVQDTGSVVTQWFEKVADTHVGPVWGDLKEKTFPVTVLVRIEQ